MGDLITEAAHIFFETPNMLPPCVNQKTSGKLGNLGCETPGKPDNLGCKTLGKPETSGYNYFSLLKL